MYVCMYVYIYYVYIYIYIYMYVCMYVYIYLISKLSILTKKWSSPQVFREYTKERKTKKR